MTKKEAFTTSLTNILFWSVISAAFIGPGTVTTAASAGAAYRLDLLWGLAFSTLACLLLQEAAARIRLVSGLSLGEAIARRYGGAAYVKLFIAGAIIIGGMAYQAGNILGAVSGIGLLLDVSPAWPAVFLSLLAAVFLFMGRNKLIAKVLGGVVALMGVAFVLTASQQSFSFPEIALNMVQPNFPAGSELLLLGLVGTTIVPYNLFLGSGIGHTQSLKQMRWGLGVAVVLGGFISGAVLITGAGLEGLFSFEAMARHMEAGAGRGFAALFAFGLFAAGFSSALTAPLAAAITAKSVAGTAPEWQERGWKYRLVWGVVIVCGLLFGASGIKPIPMIILAQALNGFLLPWLSIYLFILLNDHQLMGQHKASILNNILLLMVIFCTLCLGLLGMVKALNGAGASVPLDKGSLLVISSLSLLVVGALAWKVAGERRG
ncbi:NRAMP family divalent metal transporter [Nafulsella turpanensis]|uniref:NRAMP family divalent metal transporter n=1 Tax=Nafulsella turpanensis TaxID=1265690 RepID=UPI00034C311E|nr:divalent metal cation transporter [Nafulsella turpanensis]